MNPQHPAPAQYRLVYRYGISFAYNWRDLLTMIDRHRRDGTLKQVQRAVRA